MRSAVLSKCAFALAFMAFMVSSCSKTGTAGNDSYGLAKKVAAPMAESKADESAGMVSRDEAAAAEPEKTALQAREAETRKLIKSGYISLECRDIDKAETSVVSLVSGLGGYVSSSSNSVDYLSMVVRVPQERFDAAMAGLKGAGKLLSRSESIEDVTLRYVDMESRIATKKILKERYTEYLKRAGKVEDLLSVERALNEVISELDSMESSFKAMRDLIDYASISVEVRLPPEAAPAARRSFLGGLARIWDGFIGFLYFASYALIAVVLFGVPAILCLGLLYWLGFGKIGLLRKFFGLLSGRRKNP